MTPNDTNTLTNQTLLQGNIAIAQAAIKAGCDFFAGYPITPSNEILTRMAVLLNQSKSGQFIQMEDEIGSICAAIGASLCGSKAMTATSGPGFSLMQEAIGYAYFIQSPLVVVNVQRAGPSTGQATRVAQGDVMQMRYGSHGDIFPVVLCPWNVSECFHFTQKAFQLAEELRQPIIIGLDETVARQRESCPSTFLDPVREETDIGLTNRPIFGKGLDLIITGSTHDESGFRRSDDPKAHDALVTQLMNKTMNNVDKLALIETYLMDDAQIAILSYGISARSSLAAVNLLRKQNVKAGLIRLKTIWPFPEQKIAKLTQAVQSIIVPELNKGQIASVVKSCVDQDKVYSLGQTDGTPLSPQTIVQAALEQTQ